MIETIQNFCVWYYTKGYPLLITGISLSVLTMLPHFLMIAWNKKDIIFKSKDSDDIVLSFLTILTCCWGTAMAWPLVILGLILWGVWIILGKWGDSYREVVKKQEDNRLSALAQLIKDDPDVKRAYDKIVADMEEDDRPEPFSY